MPHKNLLVNFKRPGPRTISYEVVEDEENYGKIVAYPFERGYGTTVVNSLRRVLLSSLPGYAISGIVINYHDEKGELKLLNSEFDNIPGVYEDTIEIVQNLKKVRVGLLDESFERKIFIELKGKKDFVAKDLEVDSQFQVFNPDQHIATLNEDAFLNIELTVTFGRGYVPADLFQEQNTEMGFVAIDALYSPVKKVTFKVESHRIEQRSDFEKFAIEVWTDGSITPVDAVADAAKILKEHFTTFINFDESLYEDSELEINEEEVSPEDENFLKTLLNPIEELELNARASNCIASADIKLIGELVIKTEDELSKIKSLGQKSLEEIREKLQQFDVEIGMDIEKKLIDRVFEHKDKILNVDNEEEEGE